MTVVRPSVMEQTSTVSPSGHSLVAILLDSRHPVPQNSESKFDQDSLALDAPMYAFPFSANFSRTAVSFLSAAMAWLLLATGCSSQPALAPPEPQTPKVSIPNGSKSSTQLQPIKEASVLMHEPWKIVLDEAKKAGVKPAFLYGSCQDMTPDRQVDMKGVAIHLFKLEGRNKPVVKLASVVTDGGGNFEFDGLIPERPVDQIDPLSYMIIADAPGRPYRYQDVETHDAEKGSRWPIGVDAKQTTVTGRVVDPQGRPIEGAIISDWKNRYRYAPGYMSTTTDTDGRFKIARVTEETRPFLEEGEEGPNGWIVVQHPDFLPGKGSYSNISREINVTLEEGCVVTGGIVDKSTRRPQANVVVQAIPIKDPDLNSELFATTDIVGQFRLVLPPETYHFVTLSHHCIAPAILDRECKRGERIVLPAFETVKPGLLTVSTRDLSSDEPSQWNWIHRPLLIKSHSPLDPPGFHRYAHAREDGKADLWLQPGTNQLSYRISKLDQREKICLPDGSPFPETVDMVADSLTEIDCVYVLPPTRQEYIEMARASLTELPSDPRERCAELIRRLIEDDAQNASFCYGFYVQELVLLGPQAVPQLAAALDQTSDTFCMSAFAFSLRAIGDQRAIPSLIRALPRAFFRGYSSNRQYNSSYFVDEPMREFFAKHSFPFDPRCSSSRTTYAEIRYSLQELTGHYIDDSVILSMSISGDPRRRALQQKMMYAHTQQWADWWDEYGVQSVKDPSFARSNLKLEEIVVPPPPPSLEFPADPRLLHFDHLDRGTISPPLQQGLAARYFLDLDTGTTYGWPKTIPQQESQFDKKPLRDWMKARGIDLVCIESPNPEGTHHFAARAIDMKVWNLTQDEYDVIEQIPHRNFLAGGTPAGDILDPQTPIPYLGDSRRQSSYRFETRDGSAGYLRIEEKRYNTHFLKNVYNEWQKADGYNGIVVWGVWISPRSKK